jgi:hypothetical protein
MAWVTPPCRRPHWPPLPPCLPNLRGDRRAIRVAAADAECRRPVARGPASAKAYLRAFLCFWEAVEGGQAEDAGLTIWSNEGHCRRRTHLVKRRASEGRRIDHLVKQRQD